VAGSAAVAPEGAAAGAGEAGVPWAGTPAGGVPDGPAAGVPDGGVLVEGGATTASAQAPGAPGISSSSSSPSPESSAWPGKGYGVAGAGMPGCPGGACGTGCADFAAPASCSPSWTWPVFVMRTPRPSVVLLTRHIPDIDG
jgi:hypothetical protein